jgi:hypothetical protein
MKSSALKTTTTTFLINLEARWMMTFHCARVSNFQTLIHPQ